MTTPSGDRPEDDYWRRPPDQTGDGAPGDPAPPGPPAPGAAGTDPAARYDGPPPTTLPPPGWRPPLHVRAAPPRQLPPQDMAGLDAVEQRAQHVTWGVGAIAGVVLLALLCLLCSRAFF
ncbi:hypothetical protein E1258_20810 [Micromonospora sp. KC207]|uniref:hypothetical protein n=1 Tax=Micromonospora sp. KC207 TaxID=2530377 RepID=UPI00104DCD6A|nr:hypothetical protein [Micromonospora sp. KC207]TDC58331.1 hypothetical protein E1258_20810 [Micromonospora sp. KC207]